MKKLMIEIYGALLVVMITTVLGAVPVTYAADSDTQEQAIAFIENALPVDISRYNMTLTKYSKLSLKDIAQFTLESDESMLVVSCYIKNNVLSSCYVETKKGQAISDRSYANLTDAAKGFLEKYQTYTKIDSANMIDMLDNVDATKNSSRTIGNTNFTISNIDVFGVETTLFTWAYTVNGAEYTKLEVGFQNGIFSSLYDTRGVYSIGDTTVNISREQAIGIAMKYSETYSYAMPGGSQVSGFNITEDRSAAKIVAYPINSTVLRPYWHVELYLNQTYPGYVEGLTIYVWANSGEVFLCSNIAYGGVEYSDTDNSDLELPVASPSPSSPSENNTTSVDLSTAVIVAAVATVAVIAASALFIKRRSK